MWANDPEMAKKWEKEEKMKKETKVKNLIRKMVREIMSEDFAGAYPKEHRNEFDKKRKKQSEVLGYKLTGTPDVRTEIGAIAKPDEIIFTDALPKTRSGKIMRRLLRALASGKEVSGDTSTLEDVSVLDKLRK